MLNKDADLKRISRTPAAVEVQSNGALFSAKWFEYSRARDIVFEAANTEFAPRYIVPSDDKRRAHLNLSATCSV